MRLASCIAAEITIGVALIAGTTSGVVWGIGHLRSETPGEAPAPRVATAPAARPAAAETRTEGIVAEPADDQPATTFAGKPDEELMAPVREAAIARVKIGKCCTSLNMRIDFDSGARAAFKPEQLHRGSMPRKEIAAYRMDRLLDIGAVPPAIGRQFRVEEIASRIQGESPADRKRFTTEMVTQSGEVKGELSWWIPDLSKPTIDGVLIDSAEGVAVWQRHLTIGSDVPERHRDLLAQISVVLVFDFVVNNLDRWSGSNILASADGTVLYFMDNTMAFRPQPRGHSKARGYLRRSQRFSRSLVSILRGLGVDEVRDAMSRDLGPFPYLLTEPEIAAVMARRDAALLYIEELIAQHGEGAVLVFP